MVIAKRLPGGVSGKAGVLCEETSKSSTGAAGVGVFARRERFTEITSGRANWRQGVTTTCRPVELGKPKPTGVFWADA
jgi:hypothetical protein